MIYFIINTNSNEHRQKKMCLQFKMNISIVNALWVILTGEHLDLEDLKLKVNFKYAFIRISMPKNISIILLI